MKKLALLGLLGLILVPFLAPAHAANPNLYVSAENSYYNNHFAGSMVIEVIVNDPNLADTSVGKGEPDVTINGNNLRMVQATDGRWYGYFANLDKAKTADQTVGLAGQGLDFGEFCSKNTTVFGPSFSESEGIAIPKTGATGATNGNSGFSTCTSVPGGSTVNNVVRYPKTINTNSAIPSGQIGLNSAVWPVIQLYSFNTSVVIQYNGAGSTQSVTLQYDDIPNITTTLDRTSYPPNSQVFATIKDIQLNQDPTARDSWSFNIVSPQTTFYMAFTENGANAANGGAGLVNLASSLSSLGFDKNGKLSMTLGSVAELQTNGYQTTTSTSDGSSKVVTFVESQPNTGIFENFDRSNISNVKIASNAPRGQSATMEYDQKSLSIVSGLGDANISLGTNQPVSGQKVPVTVTDPDQNLNSGGKDKLDVFRSTAIIPTLTIGNPGTLEGASSVKIYTASTDVLTGGTSVSSSVPDKKSDRLVLDTRPSTGIANQSFEKMSLSTGISATTLQNLLIKTSSGDQGTNWVNYDLRSLQNQLGITDYADTTMSLYFGLTDATPVTIVSSANMTGSQGLVQIPNAAISAIAGKSGTAFLVINFDASNNSSPQGSISSETDKQPIVVDLMSFGRKNNVDVTNGIYRFELQETSPTSGVFAGTMEYLIANQVNQFDANTIKSLRPISDDVKFFVNQRLIDENGINIAYSDVAQSGSNTGTSSKSDIRTHSGGAYLTTNIFRFGHPVTVVLEDPDLNTNHGTIDIYSVIDNPSSDNVDTVGDASGGILLEVLIKDIRYKRCTISGTETGGLAASGFSLVETGPDTGRFEGVFKMPSKICNKDGTELISPAGGTVDLKYHDFRDASGQASISSLTKTPTKTKLATPSSAKLDSKSYTLPKPGKTTDVTLTGKVQNYKTGTKIKFTLQTPDGKSSTLYAVATKLGSYKTILTLKPNSPTGQYSVDIEYQKNYVGKVTFMVNKK
ncbi:MAG: peptidase [Nitrosopumilaceae archaeon]|nr:peptidase [Nitrososphaerota archaeon]NDF34477.1 peptidase [Nitrosopumilaceae archaeon]